MTRPAIDASHMTPFGLWLRDNPRLDSVHQSLSIQDSDYWVHKYRVATDRVGTRALNHLMLVEVKCLDAVPTYAQADTMAIVNQALRWGNNRNMTGANGRVAKVWCWGVHVLQLSGDRPDNSGNIRWDGKAITPSILEEVLRFERSPDTLQPRSDRRHHTRSPSRQATLFPDNGGIT